LRRLNSLFDKTSAYRVGSKFAPAAIREASLNIETYSFRSKFDLEDAQICDIGDLHVVDSIDEIIDNVESDKIVHVGLRHFVRKNRPS
jgi:agmatinase